MSQTQSRIAALALAAIACAICVSTYSIFSATYDEPEHLAAGMQLIDRGLYTYDIQHPPLARLSIAVGPYLCGMRSMGRPGPLGDWEGRDLLYASPSPEAALTLARLGVVPFLVVLILATWLCAQRWIGSTQAFFAALFVATTPVLLGHAGVAALDVPGTALVLLALYFMLRWFEDFSLRSGLLLGISGGLAMATKLSAIPFLGVSGAAILWVRFFIRSPTRTPCPTAHPAPARSALLGGFVAMAIVVAVYGGGLQQLGQIAPKGPGSLDFLVGERGVIHDLAHDVAYRKAPDFPIPIGLLRMALSLKELANHNNWGHLSYLFGELGQTGWWYYYPVALSVKTQIPLLFLGLLGFGFLIVRGIKNRDWALLAPVVCFGAILIFCSVYSRINIGVRHCLILYPLLALGAAEAIVVIWRMNQKYALKAGLALVVAWQIWTPIQAYPDYLAYFNAMAGPEPEKILIDSDLDWGQGLNRLKEAVQAQKIRTLSLAYRGGADPYREGIPGVSLLPPNKQATGWVAINLLAKGLAGKGYGWLDAYQPVTRIGKSILLYFIPPRGGPGTAGDKSVKKGASSRK